MKNHKMVGGKLLQTNKKYSQLKLKQKEKIYQWMYGSYQQFYLENKRFPEAKDNDLILSRVMQHIEHAEIWIPEREVENHYKSIISRLRKRVNQEQIQKNRVPIPLVSFSVPLSICKVEDYTDVNLDHPFCFTGRTDEEKSLICPTEIMPDNIVDHEDGWRAFRICSEQDIFRSEILARIVKILASYQIELFPVSTFSTNYILIKEEDYNRVVSILKNAGYSIEHEEE